MFNFADKTKTDETIKIVKTLYVEGVAVDVWVVRVFVGVLVVVVIVGVVIVVVELVVVVRVVVIAVVLLVVVVLVVVVIAVVVLVFVVVVVFFGFTDLLSTQTFEYVSPEGRSKPPGIGCPPRIVANMSSLD